MVDTQPNFSHKVLQSGCMEIGKVGRNGVGNKRRLVAIVKGLAGGFFHADLGYGACDDERLDPRCLSVSSSLVS